MKTNIVNIGRHGEQIYMENGEIWYYSYWTDGHKDSETKKVISAEEAAKYLKSEIKEAEKNLRDAEAGVRYFSRKIKELKNYGT